MKKITLILFTLIAASLFISCGKKSDIDANGCYKDMELAIKAAEKNNQDLMVIVTMEKTDDGSENFLNNIVRSPAFKSDIASKYAVALMDFSQATYEATVEKEDATEAEKKIAAANADILSRNTKYATMLNVKETPVVYILSKEMYMIFGLYYDEENRTLDGFKALLAEKSSIVDSMHKMIYQTKIGNSDEKVAAIDALYEATNPDYRYLMLDLLESVRKLDPSNKSGLLGKYIFAAADAKSEKCMLNGDAKGAVQAYLDIENEETIPAERRQQALYTAAYMSAMSGLEDNAVVIGYLERAIKLAPESGDVPGIRRVIQALSVKE